MNRPFNIKNKIAKILRTPLYRGRVVKQKKGRGSYKRDKTEKYRY